MSEALKAQLRSLLGPAFSPSKLDAIAALVDGAAREIAVEAISSRKAIYATKAAQRDAFAPDSLNEHEKHAFAVEVCEYIEAALGSHFQWTTTT